MTTQRCRFCNTQLPDDGQFCPNCGARADQPVPEAPTRITTPLPTLAPPPPVSRPYQHDIPSSIVPNTPALPVIPNSTTAIVSLVMGILSWIVLPVVGPFVAIIAGHMARREIAQSEGRLGGAGMALAGMILGYTQVILGLVACCIVAGLAFLTTLGIQAS